jgi:hypothetical protein
MGPGNAGQRDCGAKAAPDSTFHIDALHGAAQVRHRAERGTQVVGRDSPPRHEAGTKLESSI